MQQGSLCSVARTGILRGQYRCCRDARLSAGSRAGNQCCTVAGLDRPRGETPCGGRQSGCVICHAVSPFAMRSITIFSKLWVPVTASSSSGGSPLRQVVGQWADAVG